MPNIKSFTLLLLLLNFIFSNYINAYSLHQNFPLLSIVENHITYDYVEKNLDNKALEYGAIRGFLESLEDPYTRFLDPKRTREMKARYKGTLYGIGVQLGIKHNYLTVISSSYGSPAYQAGLKPLDQIVTINGAQTEGMTIREAMSMIQGKKGSTVILGIQRKNYLSSFNVSILRNKVLLNAVSKTDIFEDKIGYIKLTSFENRNTSREFTRELNYLIDQEIAALIIDLRNNGGGLLVNSLDIANLFLSSNADIVHTLDRNNFRITERSSGKALYKDNPLILLVNEGTASSAEILAGTIKDNNRGVIVGKPTFGKASVQRIVDLPDGSSIIYTTAKYLTPLGIDISKKGITVDIEVSSLPNNTNNLIFDNLLENDPQLKTAIKVALKLSNK
jgi:carboxyl-terminal processing protease